MSKKGPFIPRALAKCDPIVTFTILSSNYYRVAWELHSSISSPRGDVPPNYYAFPAIMIYTSCMEAFFQEHLAFSRYKIESEDSNDKAQRIEEIDLLRESRSPYNDFKTWLREVFRIYDRNGVGIDTNSDEYQSAIALRELRNAVAHYSPALIEHTKWPKRIEPSLQRAKPQIINSDWVANFSSLEIADWAHETIQNLIVLFCQKSGAQCPFTSTNEGGRVRWQK